MSSEIEKDETLKGQDRVIEINRLLGSTHYINPIGGMELYSKEYKTISKSQKKSNFYHKKN